MNDLYDMNLGQLWNLLQAQPDDIKQVYNQEILDLKRGILTNVPIIYLLNNWFTPYPITRTVGVTGLGKYDIQAFYDDVQERENIIRKIILEMEDDDPTQER